MNPASFSPAARRHRAGFTLIELLTVIAIIGILAAIIIPVVGKVRSSARQTQGVSNLRQLALTGALFASDNKGRFPSGYLASIASPRRDNWFQLLESYLGNNDSNKNEILLDPSSGIRGTHVQAQFGPNPFLAPDADMAAQERAGNGLRTYSLNNIRTPSTVIYLTDAILDPVEGFASETMWSVGGGWWSAPHGPWSVSDASNATRPISTLDEVTRPGAHGDIAYRAQGNTAAKVAFADGHVAIMKKGTIEGRHLQPAFSN
jgi:prepilin-type N-terminal cleavage/methylation domain-containing protein/prepilin-type processing-associated H-X9-DG protein